MFCNQCGKEIPDDTMFCPYCGAKQESIETAPTAAQPVEPVQPMPEQQAAQPIQQPMPEQQAAAQPFVQPQPVSGAVPPVTEKKGGLPVKILIPAAAAVVVVVVLLAVLLLGGKKSSGVMNYAKDMLRYNYGSETFFNLSGQSEDADDVYSCCTSGNGETTIYITDERELFYIDNKFNEVSIADEVYSVWMGLTGENFVYVVDDNDDYYDTTLYLYNVKSKKSTKIDTGVYASSICVAPSGKTVAYLKNYEGYTDNTLYLSVGGKDSVKVDKDGCFPIAVSDSGKNFFYRNSDDKLYYYNGKDSEKIETNVSGTFFVNSTVSELLFDKNGKTYYYTPKMKEPLKVAGDSIDDLVQPGGAATRSNWLCYTYTGQAYVCGVDSFKGGVFKADGYLYWLNDKGTDAVKIVNSDSLGAVQLSEDGKSLLYIRSGELCKISKFNEDMKSTTLYDDEYLTHFVASGDLSKIYLITDEDELYYYKSQKKIEKISNDFTYDYDNIAYSESQKKIFYIEDDDLYSATTSSKSKTVVKPEVESVSSMQDGVVFSTYDDGTTTMYYLEKKDPVTLSEYDY